MDSISLLEQALEFGRRELALLCEHEVEEAAECADRRDWFVSQAWEFRNAAPVEAYKSRLLELQALQEQLTKEARNQRDSLKGQLQRSRQESRRLAGYQQAVQHARLQ